MSRKVFLISLLFLFVVGCNSSGSSEEVAQGPLPQVFVFPGAQEERLISQEVIDLPNCTGNAESSQEVTRAHTVLYTLELGLEITVSADGRAGIPGIGEVGVGAAVAANYQVGYGRSETVSRAQTVRAAAESHMQHTIQQFEVWETGEILVVASDTSQRIPYSFRRDFSIKAVAPANIGCPGSRNTPPPQLEEPSPSPTQSQLMDVVTQTKTRSEALSSYHSIYTQQGWCDLWEEMSTEGLVAGNCPQAVNTTAREDIVMNDGSTENLITGVQITINSDISVNYPACINYGIDGDYATLSGGRIQSWTTNSNVATDVTIKPNSIFSLYFRCDHIAWR